MKSRTMIDTFFNWQRASKYNFCLVERPEIPAPNLKVEHIEVPGRHGSLTIVDAYEDIEFTCKFNILKKKENVKKDILRIKEFLAGKTIISFSDNYSMYYKIKGMDLSNIRNHIEAYGEFEVTFRCDPFEYERTTFTEIKNGESLYNFSSSHSCPVFEIKGTGKGFIKINDTILNIKDLSQILTIDSENMMAYFDNGKERVNQNHKIRGDFPILVSGMNQITFSSNISSLKVNPRWRYI